MLGLFVWINYQLSRNPPPKTAARGVPPARLSFARSSLVGHSQDIEWLGSYLLPPCDPPTPLPNRLPHRAHYQALTGEVKEKLRRGQLEI